MVSFIGLRRVAGASMQAMAERTLSSSRAFDGKLISVRVDEVELQSGGRARR
jgi:hypothetical protein